MKGIEPCALPVDALLSAYSRQGAFTDCYTTLVDSSVSHADFVEAFYSSALFRVERFILKIFASRPSTDQQVQALATGSLTAFAAWEVEGRIDNQLLLRDFTGRTRSWLMVAPARHEGPGRTRLFFGSALVPRTDIRSGRKTLGAGLGAMLWFHRLYSRALLAAASRRLRQH